MMPGAPAVRSFGPALFALAVLCCAAPTGAQPKAEEAPPAASDAPGAPTMPAEATAAEAPSPLREGDPPETRAITVTQARVRLLAEGKNAAFRPTTLIERVAVEAVLPVLLDRARRGDARTRDLLPMARAARLTVETWRVHAGLFVVLLEPEGEVRGAGAYVIRVTDADTPPTAPAVILQAPHAYFDLYTGRIAAGMFFGKRDGRRARALFVNTLQRYERGEPSRRSRADVCHRPEHLFNVATDRTVAALGASLVVQLHGFDAADEKMPRGVDAIVSAGTRAVPSPGMRAMADRVRGVLGDGVRLYPSEVQTLGGTTNVQGRLLTAHRDASFVHLEMSKDVRLKLRKTPALRHTLARALFGDGPTTGGDR